MNHCLGICEMFKLKNFIMPIWWEFCKVLPVTSQHFKSKKNRRSLKLQKKCILLSTDVTSNYLQCGKILIFVYENVQLLLNCWGTLVDIFHLFKMEIDEIFNWKKVYLPTWLYYTILLKYAGHFGSKDNVSAFSTLICKKNTVSLSSDCQDTEW